MNVKNGVLATCAIGLIIVALTMAAFFLLDIERIPVNIWALIFLLLSEFALFGGLIRIQFVKADKSSIFLRVGISTTLSLYFVVTLVSVFFAGVFRESLNIFILIELAIIAFFAIVVISILVWSSRISRLSEADSSMSKNGTNEPVRGGF